MTSPRTALAGLLTLLLGGCTLVGGADGSRELGCAGFPSPRERELCDAMSASLTWQWAGHATVAPGYKPTLASVAALACGLGVSPADVPALQSLRDARPVDWRREALASWLLEVVGAGGATGTIFDPASAEFVLRHGCPPGALRPPRPGSQRPDAAARGRAGEVRGDPAPVRQGPDSPRASGGTRLASCPGRRGSTTMSIRTRLSLLAVLGVLLSVAMAFAGHLGIGGMVRASTASLTTSRVLRLHVETDMFHEGFRGDAYAAVAARSPQEVQALKAEWSARREEARQRLAEEKALSPSPEVRRILERVEGPYLRYVDDVGALVDAAAVSEAEARARLPGVMAGFEALEKSLDEASTAIEAANREASEQASHQAAEADWSMLLVGVSGALVLLGFAAVLIRSVLGPLGQVVRFMEDLAQGEGDLTVRMGLERRDELGALAGAFDRFAAKLEGVLAEVQREAEQVSGLAAVVKSSASELAGNTTSSVSSIHQTSASVQELSATLKRTAHNAGEVDQVVHEAQARAEQGGEAMSASEASMKALATSSRRIADIAEALDDIAFQTNLLALNASVEASRAGEHGRGFQVVANEVRSLAQRASASARDVKGLVESSVEQVDSSVALVSASGASFKEIVTEVSKVTGQVGDIALAAREGSTGVEEIERAVAQLERVAEATAGRVQALTETAAELDGRADAVRQQVGRFKLSA